MNAQRLPWIAVAALVTAVIALVLSLAAFGGSGWGGRDMGDAMSMNRSGTMIRSSLHSMPSRTMDMKQRQGMPMHGHGDHVTTLSGMRAMHGMGFSH